MFKSLALTVVAVTAFTPVFAADPPSAATAAETEKVMTQFRTDMQAERADVIAKGLTLSADQAAKFWPLFKQFQSEQAAIIDTQFKAIEKYANDTQHLTDTDSLAYINALLERDQKIHDLSVKWLAKFQTVLPGGMAARVIHIDRRLSLVAQVQLGSKIPLVR
jgi:Spy/CpxP family protein refolding chaperone